MTMHTDMWATSLPCELLLDIFRRLESTALIRCAAVCRPWRRVIIDNAASCLQPRPDRFLPDLLLAFLDSNCHLQQEDTTLLGRPAAENVLSMDTVVDVDPYNNPLASRDGFLLLKVWEDNALPKSLCLCNLLAGSSRSLSIPEIGNNSLGRQCLYVLTTAYDDDDGGGLAAVRIVAVKGEQNWVTYLIFSSTSGVWGPVKRSAKLTEEDHHLVEVSVNTESRYAVVCGGSVVIYWLVDIMVLRKHGDDRRCLLAMDTRTERTWTTELPEKYMSMKSLWDQLMLATSEDGQRPSLIASQWQESRHEIEVWVLAGDDSGWTLQRTIDMTTGPLVPFLPRDWEDMIWLQCFCPRSGYLFSSFMDYSGPPQQFVIAVDGSSQRLMGSESSYVLPYEMDWSTYITKMKYF